MSVNHHRNYLLLGFLWLSIMLINISDGRIGGQYLFASLSQLERIWFKELENVERMKKIIIKSNYPPKELERKGKYFVYYNYAY